MASRHLACLSLLTSLSILAGCASVAPPVAIRLEPPGLDCRPLYGTERGLLIQIGVKERFPRDAILALFRDGNQLAAFSMADVGEPPRTLVLGDPGLVPSERYQYTCGVWQDSRLLARMDMTVTAARAPARPARPRLTHQASGILIAWEPAETDLYVVVARRSVLGGQDPAIISPALRSNSWLDTAVQPGEVYAYSLRYLLLSDEVRWYSELGSEGYLDVPGT